MENSPQDKIVEIIASKYPELLSSTPAILGMCELYHLMKTPGVIEDIRADVLAIWAKYELESGIIKNKSVEHWQRLKEKWTPKT